MTHAGYPNDMFRPNSRQSSGLITRMCAIFARIKTDIAPFVCKNYKYYAIVLITTGTFNKLSKVKCIETCMLCCVVYGLYKILLKFMKMNIFYKTCRTEFKYSV